MTGDIIDHIKSSLDIVDVIGETVSLKPTSGGWYKGAVSSTSTSGASLHVNRREQYYNDWANKATPQKGDVLNWIAYVENLDIERDFPQVLRIAADKAGIELPEMSEEEKKNISENKEVHDILTQAVEVYHENIKTVNPELYEFIKYTWGISKETVDRLKIGYADPKIPDLKDIPKEKQILAGLRNPKTNREHFIGRIIFPYWKNGKVVYLIGRETDKSPKWEKENRMKYKKLLTHTEERTQVSPAVQNRYFYGEDSLRGAESCIITEGVTDCISLLQADFNSISPVTVRFRKEDHEKVLSLVKNLETVYICNDNEESEAGEKGALDTALYLREHDIEAYLVTLPRPEDKDKIDIAEYLQDHTAEDFKDLLDDAEDVLNYLLGKERPSSRERDRFKQATKFIKAHILKVPETEAEHFIMENVRSHFGFKAAESKIMVREYKNARKDLIIKEKVKAKEEREAEFNNRMEELKGILSNGDGKYTYGDVIKARKELLNLYLEKKRFIWYTNKGEPRIDKASVAEYLRIAFNTLSYTDTVYFYDYEKCLYSEAGGVLKREVQKIVEILNHKQESITGITKEVLHFITYKRPLQDYPFNQYTEYLNVKNGVLKLDFESKNAKLIGKSPKFKFNYCLSVDYKPEIDPEKIHEFFISTVVPEDKQAILYQIPAQAMLELLRHGPYKKCYLLQGDPNAGKTTYLEDLLEECIGQKNVSKLSLQMLAENRFALAGLEAKVMNLHDDMGTASVQDVGVIKKLTGGVRQEIERKHFQPYEADITAVHCFTCNKAPDVEVSLDDDPAFWERWEFVQFPYSFPKDPEFKKLLKTEEMKSSFLNKVLQIMFEIRDNGLMAKHSPLEVYDHWHYTNDPLFKFLKECFVPTGFENAIHVEKKDLYNAYRQYCDEHAIRQDTILSFEKGNFGKKLSGYGVKESHATSSAGIKEKRYKLCLQLKPDCPYDIKPVEMMKKDTRKQTSFEV